MMPAATCLRARLGGKGIVIAALMGPLAAGIWHYGPRAGLVVATSVLVCVAAGIVTRLLARQPARLWHPGSVVTGLLLGLTVTGDIPLYMVVVGALVAELPGKHRLPWLGRNLFNPAALGRAAIAALETIDAAPTYGHQVIDAVTAASVLFKDAGGYERPDLMSVFWGPTPGAIGESSAWLLLLCGVPVLLFGVLKREAALAMLIATPIAIVALPVTPEIIGHAPWVLDPAVYVLGSATLLNAFFFLTDPVTTPNTRWGGLIFGVGAAVLGVIGRLYTTIPGAEMYGILAMNLVTPALDWLGRCPLIKHRVPPPEPTFPTELDRVSTVPPPVSLAHMAYTAPFAGLARAPDPDDIFEVVRTAELRGCGGGGFPVAAKWDAVRRRSGPRILVANGQEGEPDSQKDRCLMQHSPHRVVEGALLAARAIGVDRIVIVICPAFAAGRRAIEAAIAESGQTIELVDGPGRYVAGEETALLEHLATRRAEPQNRPPFPAERGLGGRPTVVHNVETLAWVSAIVERGAIAARLVTVSGAVRRPGIYEIAIGTPLSEIIEHAGGADGEISALAVGGPSGVLLPPHRFDLPFCDAELQAVGARIGTASIRGLEASECAVCDGLATAQFFAAHSCGRCAPCRIGTTALAQEWSRIAGGAAESDAIERLTEIADAVAWTSSCGLGRAAPNRLRSILRHWPDAVAAHVRGDAPCQAPTIPEGP